ncbi:MAG: hypothetical protein JXA96_10685 [Sedimentisphaerales bacterium]|nr:hypothetical protein [Sedimentisphaerales bacterium]
MIYIRYILSGGILIISLYMIFYNDIIVPYHCYIQKRKESESLIPIVGGLFGWIGLSLLPVNISWWVILPLFIDIGCLPMIIAALIDICILKRWKKKDKWH